MKTKTFLALMLGTMLVFTACKKDKADEPANPKDNTEQSSSEDQEEQGNQETDPVDNIDPFNGYEYVDLGLTSGNLWATCNVGADTIGKIGDYFAWGEVASKTDFGWVNYRYGNASNAITKYCYDADYGLDGFTDDKMTLSDEDELVKAIWGGVWRMPTPADFQELIDECSWVDDLVAGEVGCRVTGPNGNSIFLPLGGYINGSELSATSNGYYMSNTLNEELPFGFDGLWFQIGNEGVSGLDRSHGYTVRPVASAQE